MKLGIAGTGLIAHEVLPILEQCGWTPSALCCTPRSLENAQALADSHHILSIYTDFSHMLKEADMDAVYIAVPNFLHYDFARQALLSGHHVIVEKPMTSNVHETESLINLAKEKGLMLFEAITTLYLPVYAKIQAWLPRIGTIKLAHCNFSQYSSRYDAFLAGETPTVFDPEKSGGALMDLNVYNIFFLIGLFGRPQKISYSANIERGIDTSGILDLDYGNFKAACLAAKDCGAPSICTIQGSKGYITLNSPASKCLSATLHLNDGTEDFFEDRLSSRLTAEFTSFAHEIASNAPAFCYETLEKSLAVSEILTEARRIVGLSFPADPK